MSLHARCHARDYFAESGLAIGDLDRDHFRELAKCINLSIQASDGDMRDLKVAGRIRIVTTGAMRTVEIRCRSDYFDNREAVTFNRDGFIGICGWADMRNSMAFTRGFCAWVDELAPDYWAARAAGLEDSLAKVLRTCNPDLEVVEVVGSSEYEPMLADLVKRIATKEGEQDPPIWLSQDRIEGIVRRCRTSLATASVGEYR